jgi:hypothetical protein
LTRDTAIGHELVHALHAVLGEIEATHEKSSGNMRFLHWDFYAFKKEDFTWTDILGRTRTQAIRLEELRTVGLGRFRDEHLQ